ncbi:putative aspartic-type endopeptidase opsB [Parachaetomium inaequale]|uniref:Probable aspartic-type endopeptidase OPSB n=1 Tax=Parachaetomium inaequale TaxID=2588326 RepID=A0AAN6PJ44_9PEZI|nr:putative aspartic-type endopeptidase opsB [Parachaetomium inaequale]
MKTVSLLAVAATLAQTIHCLSIPKGNNGPRVLGLETQRRTPRNPVHRDKLRKRGTFEVGLDNEETLYFINGTVGTPPRPVRLHIDTGSSDLWVNTPSSKLCTSGSNPCAYAGTYSANSSSTYQYIASNFNISYVDGSGASGDYVSDTVTIGSQKLDRLQFGVGYSSSNGQGILGIGYPLNEVQVGRAGLRPYNNLPAQLVAEGVIQSNAYSLWLNDLNANTGNILFGGVDAEKYIPPLQSLPIESKSGVYAEFMITLTKLQLGTKTIGADTNNGNLALAVLLDTGSSLTYLPDNLVSEIYAAVGAVFNSDANAAYVPCALARDTTTTLNFTFTSPTIAVEMNELVLDLVTSTGQRPTFENGVPACLFGIGPAGAGTNVLGDTFLRSAYVVYDLDNHEIALAPTRFNSSSAFTASRVLEIGTGQGAVPGVTRVQNPVKATEGLRGLNESAGVRGVEGAGRGVVVGLVAVVVAVVGTL